MYFIQVYYINCLKLQYFIDRYLPVSMEKIQCGIVCIFETSVRAICGVNGIFFILCHTCICMRRIKEGWLVGFVALRPKSTAMVIAGRSFHLTTLFPGQA